MLSDRIDEALTPLNNVNDALVNTANIAGGTIKQIQNDITSIPNTVMSDVTSEISSVTSNLQSEINKITNLTTPVTDLIGDVSNISNSIGSIANNITTPFDVVGEGIDDIKGLANELDKLTCGVISSSIKSALGGASGITTAIQRTALAIQSKVSEVIQVVKEVLALPTTVLPKVIKAVKKKIAAEISSVLGELDVLNSVLSELPTELGDCGSLDIDADASLFDNVSSLVSQATSGKNMLLSTIDRAQGFVSGAISSAESLMSLRVDEWLVSQYLIDSIKNPLDTVYNDILNIDSYVSALENKLIDPLSVFIYPQSTIDRVNYQFEELVEDINNFSLDRTSANYNKVVSSVSQVDSNLNELLSLGSITRTDLSRNGVIDNKKTLAELPLNLSTSANPEDFVSVIIDMQNSTDVSIQKVANNNDSYKTVVLSELNVLKKEMDTLMPLVDKVDAELLDAAYDKFEKIDKVFLTGYNKLNEDATSSITDIKNMASDIFDNVIGVAQEFSDIVEKPLTSKCDR